MEKRRSRETRASIGFHGFLVVCDDASARVRDARRAPMR
jgi:hypothetical protein